MDCLTWEGLGNRINAMASSLVATEGTVYLKWAVNKHCPLPFEEVFDPVPRVEVQNVFAKRFPYSVKTDRICYYYVCNPARIRRKFGCSITDQYVTLLRSLIPYKRIKLKQNSAGLHYRKHMPESPPVPEFIEYARQWLQRRKNPPLFISSDSSESMEELLKAFPEAIHQNTDRRPKTDFDRTEENFRSWIQALQTFYRCRAGVLSSTKRSTSLDVIRGYGVRVSYAETKQNHRNNFIEKRINASSTS